MKRQIITTVLSLTTVTSITVSASPLISAADPILEDAKLVDFEDIPVGEHHSLVLNGVTINSTGSSMTICDGCAGGNGRYGDIGRSLQNTSGLSANYELVFDNFISAFGIVGGGFDNPWTYTAYDGSDNILDVLFVNEPCCAGIFAGFSENNIARVELASDHSDWVVFDNLVFVEKAVGVVPEPETTGLLAFGIAGGLLFRRFAKNSVRKIKQGLGLKSQIA